MKKSFILLLYVIWVIFIMTGEMAFAATVGNPIDIDIPSRSILLRQQIIDETLDEYEESVVVKTGVDFEVVFNKDLKAPAEVRLGKLNAPEMEGQWNMAKLGITLFNRVEPYVKLGTSRLEVKWSQGNGSVTDAVDVIEVETDYGFAWGWGIKGVLFELDDLGLRLTGDAQYRAADLDVDDISRAGSGISTSNAGAEFDVEEWQFSIALSKKFQLPLRWQDIYIVPYTGLTLSDSVVDVSFRDTGPPSELLSLFDAGNDSKLGMFLGLDILTDLKSAFLFNIEARFLNEYALSLGATTKF